jgi:hypothetical protein
VYSIMGDTPKAPPGIQEIQAVILADALRGYGVDASAMSF